MNLNKYKIRPRRKKVKPCKRKIPQWNDFACVASNMQVSWMWHHSLDTYWIFFLHFPLSHQPHSFPSLPKQKENQKLSLKPIQQIYNHISDISISMSYKMKFTSFKGQIRFCKTNFTSHCSRFFFFFKLQIVLG